MRQPQARKCFGGWPRARWRNAVRDECVRRVRRSAATRRPEAAALARRRARRQQDRAAPFAAQREALETRSTISSTGADHPTLRIGRQQADREGRHAHVSRGIDQQLLRPEPVTEVAEDERAERPGHEADGERNEGQQGADERVEAGKNSLLKTSAAAEP